MSASSQPRYTLALFTPKIRECINTAAICVEKCVFIDTEPFLECDEALWIVSGEKLDRRKLLELLVIMSSALDDGEILIDCNALCYSPVAEILLTYVILLGLKPSSVKLVLSSCDEKVVKAADVAKIWLLCK